MRGIIMSTKDIFVQEFYYEKLILKINLIGIGCHSYHIGKKHLPMANSFSIFFSNFLKWNLASYEFDVCYVQNRPHVQASPQK